jgi:glutamyl-tRNA reductase
LHLVVAGVNHRTAPVALREKVAISEHKLPAMLRALADRDEVRETAIVSTCNRTEIYAILGDAGALFAENILTEYLAEIGGVPASLFSGHIYFHRDERAAEHLMRVASGLDSMIVGENQILGQVKAAYEVSRSAGVTGSYLNTLFQSALAVGKRVRTETNIGHGAFSVGSAAVELATRIFGDSLAGKTVLVLGAGKMSELTARHLLSRGSPAVLVTNRTYERACVLAEQIGDGASARHFTELPNALHESDIIICSTSAPHPVVTRDLIAASMRSRRNRPLFLVDIAVPRDVEPEVGDMPDVYLYNIDDLGEVVARDQDRRQVEARRAETMIAAAVEQHHAWRRSLEVIPLVTSVRERLDAIQAGEMAKLRARLPNLSEHELKAIEAAMQSVTGKVAHDAIGAIKECAIGGDGAAGIGGLEAIRAAFGLSRDKTREAAEFVPAPDAAPQSNPASPALIQKAAGKTS